MPTWNTQGNFIYIFSVLVIFKWLLYLKCIVKKCKPIFYDLGPSLFAQALLHTSALRNFPARQFHVLSYSLKINDLTYCILE